MIGNIVKLNDDNGTSVYDFVRKDILAAKKMELDEAIIWCAFWHVTKFNKRIYMSLLHTVFMMMMLL